MAQGEETVDELKEKLSFNRQQLKKVKQLLAKQGENETLRTLKRDLEQVIKLTDELVHLKEGKVIAAKDGTEAQRSVAPSIPEGKRRGVKRKPPREWGEEKDRWEAGERTQVKVHGRWELGVVTGRAKDGNGKMMWDLDLLERNQKVKAHKSKMRTYVVPLKAEIVIGNEVRAYAIGKFKRGMVEDITRDGKYRISFLRTGNQVVVPLRDIQVMKIKTQKMVKDSKGFWHVSEPVIPKNLDILDADNVDEQKRKKKRRKQIRKEHNLLLKQAAEQNRRNNWKSFQKKIKKKSKRSIGTSLKSFKGGSMFAAPTTLEQRVGVGHGVPKMTKYHEQKHHHALKRNIDVDDEYSDDDYE